MEVWMNSRLAGLVAGCILAVTVWPCHASETGKSVNERLLVIHPVGSVKEKQSSESVYDGIVEQLTDKGFRVVDKASAEHCSIQIAATHEIDPDLNRAASFGLKFFAENIIFYKTTTFIKDNDS